MQRTQQIASFSIVLGIGVLALKTGAWWLTNSAALFSDALESTVNVAASLIALARLACRGAPGRCQPPVWPSESRVLRRRGGGGADHRRQHRDPAACLG